MIKIHKGANKGYTYFWYTVEGINKKILVTSETFNSKQSCIKGIKALNKLFTVDGFQLYDTSTKETIFLKD